MIQQMPTMSVNMMASMAVDIVTFLKMTMPPITRMMPMSTPRILQPAGSPISTSELTMRTTPEMRK